MLDSEANEALSRFQTWLHGRAPHALVVEVGTRRWGRNATHHAAWLPPRTWHLKVDVMLGADVELVADLEALSLRTDVADAVIACSVFEHVPRPWRAVAEIARVLRPGGAVYVQTHQTFPLHGYPHDYWRFTRDALLLLCADAGLLGGVASYAFPCDISPPMEVHEWNPTAPAYLNVDVVAWKGDG
jgi:SAM-dependent methyltransferase